LADIFDIIVLVEPKDNLFGMIWMLYNFYIH